MKKLKDLLSSPPTLKKIDYECGKPVILTMDTSPIGIGWVIGQDNESGKSYAVIF